MSSDYYGGIAGEIAESRPPVPRCELHGEMHLRLAADPARDASTVDLVYICHGFDGEGCGRMVLADA